MSGKKYYIGLACTFHDSAIAIIDSEGKILFAEATERFTQSKRAPGIVSDDGNNIAELIKKYCPDGNEFVISYSWSRSFYNNLIFQSITGVLGFKMKMVDFLLRKIPGDILNCYDLIGLQRQQMNTINQTGISLKKSLRAIFKNCRVKNFYYNHHLTHAVYACYTSPFDEGTCVVVDGIGEKGSFSIYHYKENKIKPIFIQKNLGSMGFFYALITSLCGFDFFKGEQWKVMGLAPYGQVNKSFYLLLKSMVRVKGYSFRFTFFKWLNSLKELSANVNRASFKDTADMACTGQLVFSEIMEELLNNVYKLSPSQNLIYTGGCALNSSFNGKILSKTNFRQLYVPSAPADDGNAVGAALISYYKENINNGSIHKNYSPYLGSSMSEFTLNNLLKFGGIKNIRCFEKDINEITATLIAEGKLVGWIQGRAEFGPRALGNRSILADPRSTEMKDKINSCIKFREEFRPFSPAILHEYGPEYFKKYEESPFMERTLVFKEEVLHKIPAVVHIDNSGRLQSVKKETNEKFYQLINSFYLKTGIPLLLNTSLNVMGKPIIHSVEDAIGIFFTSGLDVLVIDNYLIEK